MTSLSTQDLISKIATTEKTTELGEYWEGRYAKLFDNGLFQLSDKTVDTLLKDRVEKPTTPFGDILLLKHLDANKHLDEIKLQSTIETAVRFLDGCLEAIKFSEEAKNTISLYRKIGLGIGDIYEYLEQKNTDQQLLEIDKIGSLLSNSAYRASENLAEEKGDCKNWSKINKHLRAKSFEIWINEETNERRNGLDMAENYDQEMVLASKFSIIPRRNSNILLLPPDLEWQLWSDRDDSSPKTPIEGEESKEPSNFYEANSGNEEETGEDKEEDLNFNNEIPFGNQESSTEPELTKAESADISNPFQNIELTPLTNFENNLSKTDLEKIQPSENIFKAEEEHKDVEIPVLNGFHSDEPKENEDDERDLNFGYQEPEPEDFQVGELVQILKENDLHSGVISQIVEIIPGNQNAGARYKLEGGAEDIENVLWSAKDLQAVDLDELLFELNSKIGDHSVFHHEEEIDEVLKEKISQKEKALEEQFEKKLKEEVSKKEALSETEIEKRAEEKAKLLSNNLEEQLRSKIKQEIRLELKKEYEEKALEFVNSGNSDDKEELYDEIKKLKSELDQKNQELIETSIQTEAEISKALADFASSMEFQREVDKRVEEYLNSEEVEKEIEKRVQERLRQNRPIQNTQPVHTSTISALKMMTKYQK